MTNRRTFMLFVLLSTTAHAQWLNFPAAGTPRTRDGKPNLAAPAPRAPDGKPDLSGVWEPEPTPDSEALAARLDEPPVRLSRPRRSSSPWSGSCQRVPPELGIRVLTPISYWERLRPWAGLWW